MLYIPCSCANFQIQGGELIDISSGLFAGSLVCYSSDDPPFSFWYVLLIIALLLSEDSLAYNTAFTSKLYNLLVMINFLVILQTVWYGLLWLGLPDCTHGGQLNHNKLLMIPCPLFCRQLHFLTSFWLIFLHPCQRYVLVYREVLIVDSFLVYREVLIVDCFLVWHIPTWRQKDRTGC